LRFTATHETGEVNDKRLIYIRSPLQKMNNNKEDSESYDEQSNVSRVSYMAD